MKYFVLRRFIRSVIVLFAVVTVIFVMLHAAPGDPAQIYLGLNADPQALAAMRHQLGEDRPIFGQYGTYLGNLLQGDLGKSALTGQSVSRLLIDRIPRTLELALVTLLWSTVFGLILGG